MTKKAKAQITVQAAPFDIGQTVKISLSLMGFSLKAETITKNPIRISLSGTSGMSFRSWGEEISVEIFEDGHGGSIVKGKSVAVVPTTIFDYGQNKDNLERLFQVLVTKFGSTSRLVVEEEVI